MHICKFQYVLCILFVPFCRYIVLDVVYGVDELQCFVSVGQPSDLPLEDSLHRSVGAYSSAVF